MVEACPGANHSCDGVVSWCTAAEFTSSQVPPSTVLIAFFRPEISREQLRLTMTFALNGSEEHVLFIQPLPYEQLLVQATHGHAMPATDIQRAGQRRQSHVVQNLSRLASPGPT